MNVNRTQVQEWLRILKAGKYRPCTHNCALTAHNNENSAKDVSAPADDAKIN